MLVGELFPIQSGMCHAEKVNNRYIESNSHPTMSPDSEKVNYRVLGFFKKFWELNEVMWTTNAGLVESHAWDSRPSEWPWLRRGISFWYLLIQDVEDLIDRGKDHRQVYLIGNPVVWWSSTLAIAVYLVIKAVSILRWQRGCQDYSNRMSCSDLINGSYMEAL